MNKDKKLLSLIKTFTINTNILTFEGPLCIDNIKKVTIPNSKKDELKKYILNVFHNAKPFVSKDNYKCNDILDYDTYHLRLTKPDNSTLLELLEAYVLLSYEYNNYDWVNFCCNNIKGTFNIFCNNCTNCDNCDNCVYCNHCNDCINCKFSNYLDDCRDCDKCIDCEICSTCLGIYSKNNRYKINN